MTLAALFRHDSLMWLPYVYVACGGALGATGRYAATVFLYGWIKQPWIPFATVAVNILGCLLIGILAGWGEARPGAVPPPVRLLLMTGVLGGFTTFSALGLETFELIRLARPGAALIYAGAQGAFGLAAVAFGFYLAHWSTTGLPQ